MSGAEAPTGVRWSSLLGRAGRFLHGLPAIATFGLAAAWAGMIWALSSRSFEALQGEQSFWFRTTANLAHAPLFGILALFVTAFVLRVLVPPRGGAGDGGLALPRLRALHAVLVLLVVVGYGAVDEWHQSSTALRDASPLDVVTDAVGALCVLSVVALLGARPADERALRRRLLACVAGCIATAAGVTLAG